MSASTDERITALAGSQHGVVTRAQLLDLGVTPRRLDKLQASGLLRRLHRGVYILGHLRGPLEPERAPAMAAVLACGPGAVLSHWHAGGLLDLTPTPPVSASIHIRVPPGRTPARRPGIRVHTSAVLSLVDVTTVDSVPVTAAARTLCDLAAVADSRTLERAVARAARNGLITSDEIDGLVEQRRGRLGGPLLRAVVQREGRPAFTRSEVEDSFLDLIRGTGLAPPRVNVVLHGREVDFLWEYEGVVVEIDGFAYHSSRRSFASDRRRDGRFMARGIRVLRFTWEQVVHEPKATLVTLAQALAQTGDTRARG